MNIKYAAVPIIAMLVTGCNIDRFAKPDEPSDFQKHAERLDALEANYAKVAAPVTPVSSAIPFVQVPQPECTTDVFRISRCVDGKNGPW